MAKIFEGECPRRKLRESDGYYRLVTLILRFFHFRPTHVLIFSVPSKKAGETGTLPTPLVMNPIHDLQFLSTPPRFPSGEKVPEALHVLD